MTLYYILLYAFRNIYSILPLGHILKCGYIAASIRLVQSMVNCAKFNAENVSKLDLPGRPSVYDRMEMSIASQCLHVVVYFLTVCLESTFMCSLFKFIN